MAPKHRRWRYKPGQRERRERRLARELLAEESAGSSGGPPLTLYHPGLATRLPEAIFDSVEEDTTGRSSVDAAVIQVDDDGEEYVEVLLDEEPDPEPTAGPG